MNPPTKKQEQFVSLHALSRKHILSKPIGLQSMIILKSKKEV